jgi:hypothetical protein
MADNQGDEGTGQGLAERARQNAEANAYITQRDRPAEESKPGYVDPKGDPNSPKTRYGAHPERGEKRIDVSDWMKALPTQKPKVYDDGGKVNVQKTDVNDGNHEIAILKHGERVLTPEQNTDWEHAKSLGGVSGNAPTKLPIGGKDTRDANDVTPDMTPKKVYDKGGKVGDKDNYHHGDYSPTEKSEFHRSMSSLHKGGLHRALGLAEGEKIPMAKIEAATHSENGHLRKMATMAKSMHSWKHGK